MKDIQLPLLLCLFFPLILVQAKRWEETTVQGISLLSVRAVDDNEVYAAGLDAEMGPLLYYSTNRGDTWKSIKSAGNNLNLAVTKDKSHVCVVGTQSYCLTRNVADFRPIDLPIKINAHSVYSKGANGIAFVMQTEHEGKAVNGVLHTDSLEQPLWNLVDIQMSGAEGFAATHGSFPSDDVWYITSGGWPARDDLALNRLTGKLSINLGDDFPALNYELKSLKLNRGDAYSGAISKTKDGGKTWVKVFDSNRKYYFNQIHCIDVLHCVAVGEGSQTTLVLLTKDGGEKWQTSLSLSGDYSLHACQMLSRDEIWVAGGTLIRDNLRKRALSDSGTDPTTFIGVYYHSVTAGADWELTTAEGYAYDLSFSTSSIGYSANIHRKGGKLLRNIGAK